MYTHPAALIELIKTFGLKTIRKLGIKADSVWLNKKKPNISKIITIGFKPNQIQLGFKSIKKFKKVYLC